MTQLKTVKGIKLFTATLLPLAGVELHDQDGVIVAVKQGVTIGEVESAQTYADPKTKAKSSPVKLDALIPDIDGAALVGKDPTTLTQQELIALATYLQSLTPAAAGNKATPNDDEPKQKATSSRKQDEDEDEDDAFELPEGLETYEAIAALGVKEMWSQIGKHIATEAGIKARTPKEDMLEAIAEFFELQEPDDVGFDEEEDDDDEVPTRRNSRRSRHEEDEIDDEDDEEEDEDDDIDEDDIDDEDEIDEDDDIDDDEDDYSLEDEIDDVFSTKDKKSIMAFFKKHNLEIPRKQVSIASLKRIAEDALLKS